MVSSLRSHFYKLWVNFTKAGSNSIPSQSFELLITNNKLFQVFNPSENRDDSIKIYNSQNNSTMYNKIPLQLLLLLEAVLKVGA